MCGIAGILFGEGKAHGDSLAAISLQMATSLQHRGPDEGDIWTDPSAGIGLAFRRLAIIDLTAAGHQPMVSADGRWVLIYNGEVYNAEELRPELPGIAWRGHSDTEVMLEGFARWGVRATVERLIGMFAFALWDRQSRTLHLARDRLGIKPLYWHASGTAFVFGSELKALRCYPDWSPQIDRSALAAFMRHSYVPGPQSIYEGVKKLQPGHLLTVTPDGTTRDETFWDLSQVAQRGRASQLDVTDAEAVEQLDRLLRDAIGRRMVSDVPLGAFLSGGVDSSTVVALMQAQSTRPIRTFSIGFNEKGYDEAAHARAVAQALGTDHTELYVEPQQALDVIPQLPTIYDEPFADPSQIPTYVLSKLTRRHVTVSLSGDGGDELFAGYNRYLFAERVQAWMRTLPAPLRSSIEAMVHALSPSNWNAILRLASAGRLPQHGGDKLYKLMELMRGRPDDLYRKLVSQWQEPEALVLGAREPRGLIWDPAAVQALPSELERMQFLDTMTYLPDDILTKVDRASMAVALEARVPLIDHRVVEFCWRLPRKFKIRNGVSKWLLRQVLHRYVPSRLIERPKMGFGVPIEHWLRGPLRDWAETLLSAERLGRDGYLNPGLVRERWQDHLSGRRNWHYQLWNVLMFQAWLDDQRRSVKHHETVL